MNIWRVGEDRGSKEMDGCPLTPTNNLQRPKDKVKKMQKGLKG
jgi:hypothetical protein